jgi:D-arabinose 1-dehydrogenase-like Zn-dependent alcohol dehydrogenase
VATMTAARLDTQLNALRLDTVQIPDPSADEVRIKVAHAGICLTDIHFVSGEPKDIPTPPCRTVR